MRQSSSYARLAYPLIGAAGAIVLWQASCVFLLRDEFATAFSPRSTAHALIEMISNGILARQAAPSLTRVGIGLLISAIVGIPIGVLIGLFPAANQITYLVFQLIRMTSPLAWMPIAIIAFGVGPRPVIFLVAITAVWPIIINTTLGVAGVKAEWKRVVQMLGGSQWEVVRRAVIPAIIPEILTGIRIALGVSWIVIVPAEMLGVSSGLGYLILDSRDRFDYSQLMAGIMAIGILGFLADVLISRLQKHFTWPE